MFHSTLALFCCLVIVPSAFSLGFINSNLPQIPYSIAPTGAGTYVQKVDPRLKCMDLFSSFCARFYPSSLFCFYIQPYFLRRSCILRCCRRSPPHMLNVFFLFRLFFIPFIAVIFLTNHSVPPTNWYEFEPWGGRILLSLSQANNFQAWSRNQAVVVRLGLAVADPNLVEGATVILQGSSCTAVVCLFAFCGFFCPSEWSWRRKLCVVLFLDVTL